MSQDFSTICPHCGENHTIPYEDVRHHIFHILGKESARKRKDLPEHLHKMHQANILRHKSRTGLSPRQQALLDLSREIDLDTLTLKEIADRIGLTGKYRASYAWSLMRKLEEKGLLSVKRRMPAFPVDQI
jgi:hypothetical protein